MILEELQNEAAQPAAAEDARPAEPEVEMEMEMPGEGEAEKPGMMDDTGTKIDYSGYEPIQFKNNFWTCYIKIQNIYGH